MLGCSAGALIAERLRATVAQQLSFTCSAGIGPNKLLAKIGSAKNKPNKQTVVLPRAIESLMQVGGPGGHGDSSHNCPAVPAMFRPLSVALVS